MDETIDERRLIFVGGAPRSGTTLVQRILGSHSEIYAGPEFDLIPEIIALRGSFIEKINRGRIDKYLNYKNVDDVFHDFILSIFNYKLTDEKCKFISEKTPSNIEVFNELITIFPNAKFIFVLRDPRAIASSMLDVGRKIKKNSGYAPCFVRNIRNAIQYINICWDAGFSAKMNSGRIHMVFYEDIVTNPYKTIVAMCDFLNIKAENSMTAIENSQFHTARLSENDPWYLPEQLSSKIYNTSIDEWTNKLSNYQKYLVETLTIQDSIIVKKYFSGDLQRHSFIYPLFDAIDHAVSLLHGKLFKFSRYIKRLFV